MSGGANVRSPLLQNGENGHQDGREVRLLPLYDFDKLVI